MTEKTASLERAASVIKAGGVIVCPSEGVYGLSCDARNEEAVKRVIAIKERSDTKGLITIAQSFDGIRPYVSLDLLVPDFEDRIKKIWPGPHTLILPCRADYSRTLTGGRGTLALRISAFKPLSDLCALTATALVSTSANLAGCPPVTEFSKLDPVIAQRTDLILDLPCGGLAGPTSIYDCLNHTLIREGPLWPEDFHL